LKTPTHDVPGEKMAYSNNADTDHASRAPKGRTRHPGGPPGTQPSAGRGFCSPSLERRMGSKKPGLGGKKNEHFEDMKSEGVGIWAGQRRAGMPSGGGNRLIACAHPTGFFHRTNVPGPSKRLFLWGGTTYRQPLTRSDTSLTSSPRWVALSVWVAHE